MNAKTGAPQARGPLSKPLVEVIERSEDYEREEARNDASTKFWNSAAWSALILFRAPNRIYRTNDNPLDLPEIMGVYFFFQRYPDSVHITDPFCLLKVSESVVNQMFYF